MSFGRTVRAVAMLRLLDTCSAKQQEQEKACTVSHLVSKHSANLLTRMPYKLGSARSCVSEAKELS
eukprot:6184044-Pleurochrysis_carterae.AAC.2